MTKKRNKDQAEALLINTGLITSETAEATATNVVTAAKLKELVATGKLTQAEANLIAAKAGVTLANQKESASLLAGIGSKIKGAGTALKGLGTGILTIAQAHPVIAGITAALALCGGAALANKLKQEKAAKAIKEAYEEAKEAINGINNTFNENSSKTKEIAKEYAELAQGVNLLTNENKTLSTEKYERFLELSKQLSELYPSLTKNYDDNGVAILDLSGDVDTIVGSLDDLIERQRVLTNQEIMKQMPDLFAGYSNNVADLEKQKDEAKNAKDEIQKAYDVLNSWDGSTVWWANGGQVAKGTDNAIRSLSDYTNALDTLGIKYKQVAVDLDNDPYHNNDGYSIEADYKKYGTELHDIYVDRINKAIDDVKYAEQQFEAETSSINQYLNTWLQTEFSYNQIEDNGLQKAIQETLFNFDWSKLPEDIDKNNWNAVSEYLRRNILFSINNIDDSKVSKALSDIYSGALTSGELLEAISKVQEYFGDEHPISISLQSKVDDTQPLINNVKEKLQDEFDDKAGELTLKDLEIAANLDIPEGDLLSWDELIAKIKEVKEQQAELANQPLSISDTIDQLNTRLKPAMDSLKSAYQDIFDDDGKFDLDSVDILSTCDTIKSKLDELNNIEGITVDYSSYEDFVRVLRDSESTEQDVEIAMNALASSITKAALSGTEDFETMKAALEDLGVVNSEMVAFDTLTGNTEALDEAFSQANVSMDDFIVNAKEGTVEATKAGNAFLEEKVGAENCAEALTILGFKKELCNLQEMNTAGEVANLKTLAENAGYTGEVIQYLTELEQIYQEVASGTLTKEQILVKTGRAAVLKTLIDSAASKVQYAPKMDWSGAAKDASKSGKEAADAYLEAFEKELKILQTLRDQGVISEAEYLRRLRALYSRYFKDRKEYLDEFKKYEREYLEGRHTCPLLQ